MVIIMVRQVLALLSWRNNYSNHMTTIILQPSYIPYSGYFDLINKADVFVFYDDVQFTIRDWRTRNRIRTPNGWLWLSVPVLMNKNYQNYLINEIEINYNENWIKKHLKNLKFNYSNTPFFDEVFPIIEEHLTRKYKFLSELDIELTKAITEYLGIDVKYYIASEFEVAPELVKNERLLAVLDSIDENTDIYLSGPAAKNYLDESKFEEKDISVEWQNYSHPFYNQKTFKSNTFISYLSVLDLLFNHGRESIKIISKEKTIENRKDITLVNPDEYNMNK